MESDYTPMGSKAKIEKFVASNPDFKKAIRYEPSEKRDGFLLLTDGSFLFGYVEEDEFRQLLERKIEMNELSSAPAVFDFIDCDTLEANTRRYLRDAAESNFAKVAKAVDSKVSRFVPDKRRAVTTGIILLVLCVAVPILSSRLFSSAPKGYGDDFYQSGMVQTRLNNLIEKWNTFQENPETRNPKLATHTAMEIRQFNDEVDHARLTEKEKEVLAKLLEGTKTILGE